MTRTTSFTLATLALAASTAIAEPRQDVDKDGMFHFTFAGGTLPEYLKAVDEQFPEISIVVFPGGLEKIQVPAMKVNTFGSDDLIELIRDTGVHGGGSPQRGRNVSGGEYWSITPVIKDLGDIYSVYPLINGSPSAGAPTKSPNSYVEVYSGPRTLDMKEVLDALSAGLEMAVGEDGATVRYHEPTRLIFIETTSAGQAVTSDIIDELHGFVPMGGFGGQENKAMSAIARWSDEDYMKVIHRLEKEVVELKKKLSSDGE